METATEGHTQAHREQIISTHHPEYRMGRKVTPFCLANPRPDRGERVALSQRRYHNTSAAAQQQQPPLLSSLAPPTSLSILCTYRDQVIVSTAAPGGRSQPQDTAARKPPQSKVYGLRIRRHCPVPSKTHPSVQNVGGESLGCCST